MSVQMPHNESVPCWFYCINGSEFGPFTPKMMTDWMRDGWLPDDLQVRTLNDNRYYPVAHYKATCSGYPFNLSDPSISARVGLGSYEFGFNAQQQLAIAHEAAAMGARQQYQYPPPLPARLINLVGNASNGPFPPPPMQVPQQLRGAAIPVFHTAVPYPPVHVDAKVRTEPIQIPASRAEALLSELLQAAVKIVSVTMSPSSSSTSAGDEK